MADATFIKAIAALWQAGIDLIGNPINIVLCTSAFVPDTTASGHEFLSSIPSGARIATATLTNKSLVAGVFDADDPVFTGVPIGEVVTQAIIYQDESPESAARLIRKITDAAALPLTTNGQDITFVLPNDANKIFRTHDA